jgi:outer membrane protein, heavy metal efflux system
MRLSAQTAQQLHDAGNLNDLNLATQQAAYEQGRIELDAATAEVEQNRLALAESMGIDGGQAFSISGVLPDPTDVAGVDDLEAQAKSQRLDLLASKQALSVAQRSAKLTKTTAWLSSATIGADTERTPDGQRVTGPTFSFPIPLFDLGQAARSRANAEWSQAAWQFKALELHVANEVRASAAKVSASRQRYERLRAAVVPLRLKIADESLLQYNGMLIDVLRLLTARQLHFEASRDEIAALRDYWIARAELEHAVGGMLPTTQPTTQPATRGG